MQNLREVRFRKLWDAYVSSVCEPCTRHPEDLQHTREDAAFRLVEHIVTDAAHPRSEREFRLMRMVEVAELAPAKRPWDFTPAKVYRLAELAGGAA